MSKKKPDDVVKFTVKRGGKELTLDVKLGHRPTGGGGAGAGGGGAAVRADAVVVVLGREGESREVVKVVDGKGAEEAVGVAVLRPIPQPRSCLASSPI